MAARSADATVLSDMSAESSLVGLRLRIEIEEDGTPSPPSLPIGTITEVVKGTDGRKYYLLRLDSAVDSIRAKTNQKWTLRELAITPYFKGGNVENLLTERRDRFVFVQVLNAEGSLGLDGRLDLSKAANFALGKAMVA